MHLLIGCSGVTFTDNTLLLDGMRIGLDDVESVIHHLCEGSSIRATSRLTMIDQKTLLDLLVLIGQRLEVARCVIARQIEYIRAEANQTAQSAMRCERNATGATGIWIEVEAVRLGETCQITY